MLQAVLSNNYRITVEHCLSESGCNFTACLTAGNPVYL